MFQRDKQKLIIQIKQKKGGGSKNRPGFLMAQHELGKYPCFEQVSGAKSWGLFCHFWSS